MQRNLFYSLGIALSLAANGCSNIREKQDLTRNQIEVTIPKMPEFYETQPSMRIYNPQGLDYKIKAIIPENTDKDAQVEQKLKIRKKPSLKPKSP